MLGIGFHNVCRCIGRTLIVEPIMGRTLIEEPIMNLYDLYRREKKKLDSFA